MPAARARVVVLGGGFGGVHVARRLEHLRREGAPVDVALVSRDNHLVFQPMLAEVVAGDVGLLDTIGPLRRLLPETELFVREVAALDLDARTVTLGPAFRPRDETLRWDRLVLALGTVTDFRGLPGFPQHALPFKTLADAVNLRNHLIRVLEQASIERDADHRRAMLTIVVGGGGFSGAELAAAVNDLLRRSAPSYPAVPGDELRVVLVHSGRSVLDRELAPSLSAYATRLLRERGVELVLGSRVAAASAEGVVLSDGQRVPTRTFVSTVPSSPSPLLEELGAPMERGRLVCDRSLRLSGRDDVWAVGDCAWIPMPGGGAAPPTAQHAVRQARVAAGNVVASVAGGRPRAFAFGGLGKLGALGHHRAVAELPGGVRMSGVAAWLAWRAVYWWKLPGADRKVKVALSWLSDLVLPPDLTQLNLGGGRGVSQAHFEPGEVVFRQGDLGDALYMVLRGTATILREREDGGTVVLARVGPGEYFGEMALLSGEARGATVRCDEPLDVLTLRRGDFAALTGNLPEMRRGFEDVMRRRAAENAQALLGGSPDVDG